jgi:hypothetical protein
MKRIEELFNNMDEWRHLPSYQLERRADIFFSIYMDTLLQSRFNVEIDRVIPEFPVRIGTIHPKIDTNKSFKIDYLAKAKDSNQIIFVELKTDLGSRREKQDWYLKKAQDIGAIKLLEGLVEIYRATTAKKKYLCLLQSLEIMGLIKFSLGGEIEIIQDEYRIDVIYIQPNNKNGEENILSFHEAAEIIEQQSDELSIRFAQSLREWASVKPGDC